jgi:hypothetical protein
MIHLTLTINAGRNIRPINYVLLFHMEIILLKILFYYFRGLLKIVCFEIF